MELQLSIYCSSVCSSLVGVRYETCFILHYTVSLCSNAYSYFNIIEVAVSHQTELNLNVIVISSAFFSSCTMLFLNDIFIPLRIHSILVWMNFSITVRQMYSSHNIHLDCIWFVHTAHCIPFTFVGVQAEMLKNIGEKICNTLPLSLSLPTLYLSIHILYGCNLNK